MDSSVASHYQRIPTRKEQRRGVSTALRDKITLQLYLTYAFSSLYSARNGNYICPGYIYSNTYKYPLYICYVCCRKFFEILLALSKIYAKCKIRVNIYVCRNIVRFVEYLTIQVVLYETESNILKFKSFIRSLIIIWNFTFSVEYEVTNIIKSNSKNNSEAQIPFLQKGNPKRRRCNRETDEP